MVVEQLIAEGDWVAVRLTLRGTHLGPLGDILATGKPVTMKELVFWQVESGKLRAIWSQGDALGLRIQIGAIPASAWHSPFFRRRAGPMICWDRSPWLRSPGRHERAVIHDGAFDPTSQFAQSHQEGVCCVGIIELQLDDDVVRVILRPQHPITAHSTCSRPNWITVERLLPTVKVRNWMLDLQDMHRDLPGRQLSADSARIKH